jgi:hypothetical protein
VRVDSPDLTPEAILQKMEAVVVGKLSPFRELEYVTDWVSIKKVSFLPLPVASL